MAARPKRKPSKRQLEAGLRNIKPAKKGEVRNPSGINGWTKLRERLGEIANEEGEDVYREMLKLAKSRAQPGSVRVAAGKTVLGPVLNQHTIGVEPETAKTFADIVKAATGREDDG